MAVNPKIDEYLRDEALVRLDHARPALEGFERWDGAFTPPCGPRAACTRSLSSTVLS